MGYPNTAPRSVIASACVHFNAETEAWELQQSRGFSAVETSGADAVLVLAELAPPETITVEVSPVGTGDPPVLAANAVPIVVKATADFMVQVLRL